MGHLHLVSPVEAIFLTPVESQERFFVYVLSPSLSVIRLAKLQHSCLHGRQLSRLLS